MSEKEQVTASQQQSGTKQQQKETAMKYNKLKKKFRALKEEHLKVQDFCSSLGKQIKSLQEERKFLKYKLESLFKSQTFCDEVLFKQHQSAVADSKQQSSSM